MSPLVACDQGVRQLQLPLPTLGLAVPTPAGRASHTLLSNHDKVAGATVKGCDELRLPERDLLAVQFARIEIIELAGHRGLPHQGSGEGEQVAASRRVGPVVARRRLGAELRRLRDGAGLRLQDVANELETSVSKISRLETGHGIPRIWDVKNLLSLYGVEDDRLIARLVGWANDGRAAAWWLPYSDATPGDLGYYISLEAEAASIANYSSPVIHGLLQTEEYARSVLTALLPQQDPDTVEHLVQIRLDRKQVITRDVDPVQLHVILDESAISRVMGSAEIMRAQLHTVLELSERPNVTVQVFPFAAGAHQCMISAFTIFIPRIRPPDPVVVNIESTEHDAFEEKPDRVAVFQTMFDNLSRRIPEPAASRKIITGLLERT